MSCVIPRRRQSSVRDYVLTPAYGSHTKFIRMAFGSKENVEFDESGENVVQGTLPEGV